MLAFETLSVAQFKLVRGLLNVSNATRQNIINRLMTAAASAFNNNAEDLPITASPPTITTATAATAELTRTYPYAANAALYRISGGIPVENNTAAGYFIFPVTKIGNGTATGGNLGTWTGDPEDNQAGWSVTFQTDADVVEFQLRKNTTAGRNYRFIVDGQYVDKVGTDLSGLSGVVGYVKLDFTALVPARRLRTITVEGAGSQQHMFASVAVGPTTSIAHPGAGRPDLLALFAGDSFTEGENVTSGNKHLAWPYRAAKRLGVARLYDLAIGGTGYVSIGPGQAGRRKLVDQVTHDWNRPTFANPDFVVIANGYNDKDIASVAAIRVQARASWNAARAVFPNALFVVTGVFAGRTGPGATTLALETGLKAEFDAWADDFSLWIPVSTDPSPWQFGTGRVGATANDGNSDVTTGTDGTHPSDYGQDLIAQRFCHSFRLALGKMSA